VVQSDHELQELENSVPGFPEKGFLIAPFSREAGDPVYLIRPDLVLHNPIDADQLDKILSIPSPSVHPSGRQPAETRKEQYIKQIEEIIGQIEAAAFEKVMLSRVKSVLGRFSSRLASIFNRLCQEYNHAFVYLFCVKGNCWTGASPEPFICSCNGELFTVSLAGTRPSNPENLIIGNWNRKELLEQEYVTRHIEQVLLAFSVRDYRKKGPYIARAGNLSHLRTDFTFPYSSAGSILPSLMNALHPTPAVCGMGSAKAMDYIRQAEKHNREYYTGFLGPVGIDDLMQLYVNLRCMKILDDRCILYVGGGITKDSIPEDEWKETEIKADTLLSVLEQIR
jgi:isochorismate synthase